MASSHSDFERLFEREGVDPLKNVQQIIFIFLKYGLFWQCWLVLQLLNTLNMNEQDFDFLFKVVIVGDSAVGKTNILSRFVQDEFTIDTRPTLGVEFGTKTVITSDKKIVKNQIWDTAGQQKFRALASTYYRRAQGAFIVFDLTRHDTFDHIEKWLQGMREYAEKDICIGLIGNKCDLKNRDVLDEAIQNFISLNKLAYFQTSALNGANITQAFQWLTEQMYKKTQKTQTSQFDYFIQNLPKQQPKTPQPITIQPIKIEPAQKPNPQNKRSKKKKNCC